ncbi:hypothetical protein [Glaciimonas soli]|nr:hypothetical protein [Glaciimonas soli]
MEILKNAQEALKKIGFHCVLSQSVLPQGASLSLHVATIEIAAYAAHVAGTHGGIVAYIDSQRFADDVADFAAGAVIIKAARNTDGTQ